MTYLEAALKSRIARDVAYTAHLRGASEEERKELWRQADAAARRAEKLHVFGRRVH